MHRGRGRKIQPGQKVHASVAFCDKKYCPKASLPIDKKQRQWKDLVHSGTKFGIEWTRGWEDLLEMDIFDASTAGTVIQQIEDAVNPIVWVHRLTAMTWSGKSIYWQGIRTVRA